MRALAVSFGALPDRSLSPIGTDREADPTEGTPALIEAATNSFYDQQDKIAAAARQAVEEGASMTLLTLVQLRLGM